MTARPLVHVGYHKTASSWLQQRLFAEASAGFRFFPRTRLARAVVEPHPLAFDPATAKEQLEPWLEETRQLELVPALSHERLSGYPHSGGFDCREIAERLAAVLPEARILIVVREQRAAILSNYHQYLRDGGAVPLARYLDPPLSGHRRVPAFAPEFFLYDRLLDVYRDLFGASGVLVLAYEELRAEPSTFLRRIAEFAEAGAERRIPDTAEVLNPAPSPTALALLRWANLLFRRGPLNPAPPLPSELAAAGATRLALAVGRIPPILSFDRRLARERELVSARIDGFYAESNARLSAVVDADLGRYGYALPAR